MASAWTEIALLCDTYPDDHDGILSWADEAGQARWQAYREDPTADQTAHLRAGKELQLNLRVTEAISLAVTLPASYPDDRPAMRIVGVQSRSRHEAFNAAIKASMDEIPAGDMVLFEVYQSILELATSMAADEAQVPESAAETAEGTPEPLPSRRRRILFWSHHLISDSKRKDLQALAGPQLKVVAKVGWPGYIAAEGNLQTVQDFIKEVKTWRWQAISLRYDAEQDLSEAPLMSSAEPYTEFNSIADLAKVLSADPDWLDASRHG